MTLWRITSSKPPQWRSTAEGRGRPPSWFCPNYQSAGTRAERCLGWFVTWQKLTVTLPFSSRVLARAVLCVKHVKHSSLFLCLISSYSPQLREVSPSFNSPPPLKALSLYTALVALLSLWFCIYLFSLFTPLSYLFPQVDYKFPEARDSSQHIVDAHWILINLKLCILVLEETGLGGSLKFFIAVFSFQLAWELKKKAGKILLNNNFKALCKC